MVVPRIGLIHCSGKFICWVADEDRAQRVRSGDHGEEGCQGGALFRTRPARLAHIRLLKFDAGTGEERFEKVKGLIADFINRLQSQAASEANHKS